MAQPFAGPFAGPFPGPFLEPFPESFLGSGRALMVAGRLYPRVGPVGGFHFAGSGAVKGPAEPVFPPGFR